MEVIKVESFKEEYYKASKIFENYLNKKGFKDSSQTINIYNKNDDIANLVYKSNLAGTQNASNQISKILPSKEKKGIRESIGNLINLILELNEENGIFNPNLLVDGGVNKSYEKNMVNIAKYGVIKVSEFKQYLNQNHLNVAMAVIAPLRAEKLKDGLYHLQLRSNK